MNQIQHDYQNTLQKVRLQIFTKTGDAKFIEMYILHTVITKISWNSSLESS